MPATCTYELEIWGPHPGCKEFMTEPEAIITCGAPATHCLHFDYWGERYNEPACTEHMEMMTKGDPRTFTAYPIS